MNGTVQVTNPGAQTLLDLLDTPSSYSSQENKMAVVNSGGTAMIFLTIPGTGGSEVWQDPVLSKSNSSPPASNAVGDRHIVASGGDWYDTNWGTRIPITIDKGEVGATSTGFLLSIQLSTGSAVFSATGTQSDGEDVLFASSDKTTKLDHTIERFVKGSEVGKFLVKIPTLSTGSDTIIYMYYGNNSASSQGAGTATFDSIYSQFFMMDPLGLDSTANNRDYAGDIGDPTANDDSAGLAIAFDGNDGWNMQDVQPWENEFSIRTHNAVFTTSADITTRQVILAEGGASNGVLLYIRDSKIYARWWSESKGWSGDHQVTDSNIAINTKYWATMVYDFGGNNNYLLFVNGSLQDGTGNTATVVINAHSGNGGIAYTGSNSKDFDNALNVTGQYFTGDIHEISLLDGKAWTLEDHISWHKSSSQDANFISYGAEETPGGATDEFAGHETEIATATTTGSTGWTFDTPMLGWATYVVDELTNYSFNGTAWVVLGGVGNHANLGGLQGGSSGPPSEYYHLTGAQHTETTRYATTGQSGLMTASHAQTLLDAYSGRLIAVGTDTGTAIPEDFSFNIKGSTGVNTYSTGDKNVYVELTTGEVDARHLNTGATGTNQINTTTIPMRYKVGTPTFNSLDDIVKTFGSAGMVNSTGLGSCISTGGANEVDVCALQGMLRDTDNHIADLYTFDFAGSTGHSVPSNTIRYIGIEWNGGTPQVVVKSVDSWNTHNEFSLGSVVNENGTLHILNNPEIIANGLMHILHRFYETSPFERAERVGGLIIGETSGRKVTMTAGEVYDRLSEFVISAVDTSTGGGGDFVSYSSTGQVSTGVNVWDNLQYDNSGLTTLSNNKYANLWWYIEVDGDLIMVYGTAQYNSIGSAQNESAPSILPDRILSHGRLLGRFTFQKSATGTSAIESSFETAFTPAVITSHGNLANLNVDDHSAVYPDLSGTRAVTLGSDASGDIWYRSSTGGVVRLGVGTSGQTITISTGGLPAYTNPTGGSDVKVAVTSTGAADYLGNTSTGGILQTDDTIDYTTTGDFVKLGVALLEYLKIKRTSVVTYMDVKALDGGGIISLRVWTDETISEGSFLAQIDVPRQVTALTAPEFGQTQTGTITINGIDADGAALAVVLTINDAAGTTHTTDEAFARVTSVVVNQTDATTVSRYLVGWNDTLGLPNYPFNATTDLFKIKLNTTDKATSLYTINATYGTIAIGDSAAISTGGNDFTFWCRPFKTT